MTADIGRSPKVHHRPPVSQSSETITPGGGS
jgi:hypothetical protein